MSKVWFTADTHFSQQRTLELSRRPFINTNTMDDYLINNWNRVVGPEDAIFHLGDFGNPEIIDELTGADILLIPGNYDTTEVIEKLLKDPRVEVLNQPYSWPVPDYAYDFEGDLPWKLYFLHEPEKAKNEKLFYLYGHIHQLQMVKKNGLNVGVDCHQFKPIDLETVAFYYNAIQNHYDENVFMEVLGQ